MVILRKHLKSFKITLLQAYILMQTPTYLDPPKRIHHLILMFAMSGWVIEDKSKLLNHFSLIIYQVNSIIDYWYHIIYVQITKVYGVSWFIFEMSKYIFQYPLSYIHIISTIFCEQVTLYYYDHIFVYISNLDLVCLKESS